MTSISEMISKWWDEDSTRSEGLDKFGWGAASLEAYLKGDFSPYAKIAAKEGIEYGIGKSGSDWLVGPQGNFTPVGSGLASGGSTLAAGLLTGNTEGLAGRTAASTAGGALGNWMAGEAGKAAGAALPSFGGKMMTGGAAGAAGAAGALGGGIVGGLYEGLTKGKISKGTEFSTIGGMVGSIFGPLGTAAGSLIGGLAGGFLGKNKPRIVELSKTESGNNIVWDGTKFVPQKPLDVKVTVDGEEYQLSPQQKSGLARKLWAKSVEEANRLNERFGGKKYEEMSADDAYAFDAAVKRYSPVVMPQTEEEWWAKYDQWAKKMYGNKGEDLLNATPYEIWKKQVQEKQGWTDNPLGNNWSAGNPSMSSVAYNPTIPIHLGGSGSYLDSLLVPPEYQDDAKYLYKMGKKQDAWLAENAHLKDSKNKNLANFYNSLAQQRKQATRRGKNAEQREAEQYAIKVPEFNPLARMNGRFGLSTALIKKSQYENAHYVVPQDSQYVPQGEQQGLLVGFIPKQDEVFAENDGTPPEPQNTFTQEQIDAIRAQMGA